jgi:hypothetical protein
MGLAGLQSLHHCPGLLAGLIRKTPDTAERDIQHDVAMRSFLGLLEALPISIEPPSTGTAWHDTLALARSHRVRA